MRDGLFVGQTHVTDNVRMSSPECEHLQGSCGSGPFSECHRRMYIWFYNVFICVNSFNNERVSEWGIEQNIKSQKINIILFFIIIERKEFQLLWNNNFIYKYGSQKMLHKFKKIKGWKKTKKNTPKWNIIYADIYAINCPKANKTTKKDGIPHFDSKFHPHCQLQYKTFYESLSLSVWLQTTTKKKWKKEL